MRLEAEVDPRPLAFARIAIGVVCLLNVVEIYSCLLLVSQGRIARPLTPWLPAIDAITALGYLILTVPAAIALILGVATRFSAAWLASWMWMAMAWEQQTYSNHLSLSAWLVTWLVLSRPDGTWTLLRPGSTREPTRFGDQVLLMSQLTICYLFASLVKLNATFLSGESLKDVIRFGLSNDVYAGLAWATVLAELFVAIGLWTRRWRWAAAGTGVALHLAIPLSLSSPVSLAIFSVTCLGLYPLFFVQPLLEKRTRRSRPAAALWGDFRTRTVTRRAASVPTASEAPTASASR